LAAWRWSACCSCKIGSCNELWSQVMKQPLLALATIITISAAGTSGYIATLPNPTDTQTNLAVSVLCTSQRG
jgi:hypothetical protein